MRGRSGRPASNGPSGPPGGGVAHRTSIAGSSGAVIGVSTQSAGLLTGTSTYLLAGIAGHVPIGPYRLLAFLT